MIQGDAMFLASHVKDEMIVFVFDPLAISMVIALNKLTEKKEEDGNKLNFSIDSSIVNNGDDGIPVGDTNNEETESELSQPQEGLGRGRTEEVVETPTQKSKKVTRTKKKKEEVRFVPDGPVAESNLYGEPVKKPKHTYMITQQRIRK